MEKYKIADTEGLNEGPELATRHSDNEVIDVALTEDIAFEEGYEQGKADKDCQQYHEEQDHKAMEKANDR